MKIKHFVIALPLFVVLLLVPAGLFSHVATQMDAALPVETLPPVVEPEATAQPQQTLQALMTPQAETPEPALPVSQGPVVQYVNNPNAPDRLNLRREASTASEVIGRFYSATVVEVLGISGEFTLVRVGDLEGYMQSSYLSDVRYDLQLGPWAIVAIPKANEKLHLRATAQDGALSYGLFPNGTTIQILEDAGEYYKVRTVDAEGYMRKEFLAVDGDPKKPIMTELTAGIIEGENQVLYAFPSRESTSLGVHGPGRRVTILGIVGTWYYVEVTGINGWASEVQRGFMLSQHIKASNYNGSSVIEQLYAVVRNENEEEPVHLRNAPMWSSESINVYFNASQMAVVDSAISTEGPKPTWVHVRMGEQEGYIQGQSIDWIEKTALE